MPDSVNLGSVYATAELRLDKLETGMRQMTTRLASAETQLKQSGERMKQTANVTGLAIGAGLSLGLLALGKQILDTTVRFDSLKRGLIAVTGSAQEAERQMARLKEVAKLPGLGMEEAIQGSIRLQAAGLSAQMAERSLRAFGNAIATVGGGKAQLAEVTLALQQLTNRTSGFGQEIRQLQNALPQIRQMMIAAFGTADSERLSRSGMTGIQFIQGILPQFEKLKQVTGGIQNAIENLQDASKAAFNEIGKTGLPLVERAADKAADSLTRFVQIWKQLPKPVQDAFLGSAGIVTLLGVGTFGVGKLKGAFGEFSAVAVARLGLVAAAAGSVIYALDQINSALDRQKQIDKDRANVAKQLGVQSDLKTYLQQIDEIRNSVKYSPFITPEGRKIAQEAIERIQGRANQLVAPFRANVPAAQPGGRNMVAPVDVPITSQGRFVAVQQQMIALQAQIEKVDAAAQKATTNAQRNALGAQLLNLKARESRLQDILDQFDPNKRQQAGEQAKKEAEDRLKIARDTADEMVRITSDEFAAERFLRQREFEQSVKDGAKRADAARILAKQLNDIASREFLARTGGGFMQLLPSVEDVGKESLGFQELTKVLASASEAASGLGQAFANSLKTADYFFNVAIHNVERVVTAAKDALDGLGAAFGNVIKDAQYLDAQMRKQGESDWSKAMEDYLMNGRVRAGEQRQQQFQEGFKRQFDFMKDLAGNIADEFYDGFAKGLDKIFGRNPLGRALARTLDNALSSVMDNALSSLFSKKGGSNGFTESSGQAGALGGLGSLGLPLLLGSLLGGGGLFKGIGGLFKGIGRIFGFADGGIMPAGRLALVGERGPELVMPATATRVIPNAGGAITNNYHYTIHAGGIRDPHELVRLLGYETMKTQRVRQGSG